jgi:signal peptidase I
MTNVETKQQEPKAGVSRWRRFRAMTQDVHRGFCAEWTVTIILLLFATTTLVQAFVIPSASMESTLLIGDHVLVDKLVYAPQDGLAANALPNREVRRGDIIVFRYPLDIREDYVKRAIGIPGDHIRFVDKQLILNGKPVKEPYVQHSASYPDEYRDNFPALPAAPLRPRAMEMLRNHVENGELVVPKDYVFAMGDNRDDSDDSRYWGLVPRENIVGTPVVIYWSYDASTQDLTNGNIGLDHIVDVVTHFFTKTRWKRTFNLTRGYPLQ